MSDSWLPWTLEIADPLFTEQEKKANPPPAKPYSTTTWSALYKKPLPPRETFFGDVFALGGHIFAVQGQGGVGKSRWALNLARNNVLQRPFCGLSTGNRPLKWLFLGNENSEVRLQSDIRAMSSGLSDDELANLDAHIAIPTLEAPEDSYICLKEETIRAKYRSTIEQFQPDVLVVDPWGEVQFGDPNNDLETRASLRELGRIAYRINMNMAIVILHHARTGRTNIRQAVGWDKGNFGKGSKALFSGARAVANLAPADPDDHTRLILGCAKCNDAPPFETRGLLLDSETMTYSVDEDFDLEVWEMDVEGKRSAKAPKASKQDVVDLTQEYIRMRDLRDALAKKTGAGRSRIYDVIAQATKDGLIREGKRGVRSTGKIKPRISVESVDDE